MMGWEVVLDPVVLLGLRLGLPYGRCAHDWMCPNGPEPKSEQGRSCP